jgi:hypothetical protein
VKNSNDAIGKRTRGLPACSAVPQQPNLFKEYLLDYKYSTPATCFDHTYRHPLRGLLQNIINKLRFEPIIKCKILSYETYGVKYVIFKQKIQII